MRTGNALFFSVSGVAAARTRAVYQRLENLLPGRFPDLKITFLGDPFYVPPRRRFLYPLLWDKKERELHSTTRVLNCWSRLNEFSVRWLRTALQNSDIVVTEHFGLDGCVYSTSLCDDQKEVVEAEDLHHSIVETRVFKQGFPRPYYLIPMVEPTAAPDILRAAIPQLKNFPPETLYEIALREEKGLGRYFDPRHKQNSPIKLDATLSIEKMAWDAIRAIDAHVQSSRVA